MVYVNIYLWIPRESSFDISRSHDSRMAFILAGILLCLPVALALRRFGIMVGRQVPIQACLDTASYSATQVCEPWDTYTHIWGANLAFKCQAWTSRDLTCSNLQNAQVALKATQRDCCSVSRPCQLAD